MKSRLLANLACVASTIGLVSAPLISDAEADPSLRVRYAEANAIRFQINRLDEQLGAAAERYNGAVYQLGRTSSRLKQERAALAQAKLLQRQAQRRVAKRLRELYMRNERAETLAVILGAQSVDHLFERLELSERITAQEVRLAQQAAQLRARTSAKTIRLATTRRNQTALIIRIARQQRAIETQLNLRQQLLDSAQEEIAELERQEQARQLRMRRQLQRSLTSTPTQTAGERAVSAAIRYLGTPYTWGSADPNHGLDCSGLTLVVFAQLGIELPHYAAAQYNYGTPVPRAELKPGDLVFFRNLEHMGLYIGQGHFIHAPHTGDVVKISTLSEPDYQSTWTGARRLLQ